MSTQIKFDAERYCRHNAGRMGEWQGRDVAGLIADELHRLRMADDLNQQGAVHMREEMAALRNAVEMREYPQGDYVLHTDYAALEARHNALREAVVKFFKVDNEILSVNLREAPDSWKEEIAPRWKAARAEVDRLIENETSADCKGEV